MMNMLAGHFFLPLTATANRYMVPWVYFDRFFWKLEPLSFGLILLVHNRDSVLVLQVSKRRREDLTAWKAGGTFFGTPRHRQTASERAAGGARSFVGRLQ